MLAFLLLLVSSVDAVCRYNGLQCGENERVDDGRNGCQPEYCSDLGFPLSCQLPLQTYKPRKQRCICINGYVRDDYGICIPKEQCPSCGGDRNAKSGCGVNCGKTCADFYKKNVACPFVCNENGCDCKDGFAYDSNLGRCVRPCRCTIEPTCNANETFSKCANRGSGIKECSQLGQPETSTNYPRCQRGCVCQTDYLRNDFDECVLTTDCPNFCSGPNEVLDTCPPVDQNSETCGGLVYREVSYKSCTPTCRCIQGYYRFENQCFIDVIVEPTNPVESDSFEQFQAADVSLTKNLLSQLSKNPGGSFVVSAYTILQILATLALFAKGPTFDQLAAIINLYDTDDIRNVLDSIKGQTSVNNSDITIQLASKIYADSKYPLSDAVLESQDSQNVDFGNSAEAANIINDWVAEKTNNFINNVVSPSSFNARTRVVLVNALYFLAEWQSEFRASDTRNRDFYPGVDTPVQIPTMFQTATYSYVNRKEIDAQILKMPYKDTRASFLIYLPNKRDGLSDMITALNEDELKNVYLDDLEEKTVSLYLPVFEIVTNINLVNILTENNVTALFEPSYDLDGLLKNPDELYVSSAIQKNRIKVNEKGTEAASVTVVTVATTAAGIEPVDAVIFTADHPFVFAIALDDKTTLFAGVYNGPS